MLRNLKLGTRFNLLLLLVFICGVSISGVALSTVLQQKAQDEVASKAITLMGTMTAVRSYTSTRINPLLAPRLETETQFIPETVPAYSATEVFASAKQSLSLVMAILIIIFAVFIITINVLLNQTVIQPIKKMSHLAKEVSTGKISDDFEQTFNDEIGTLAASFNRMKSSLEIAMKMLNSQSKD